MPKELLGTTIGKLRNKLHRLMKQRYAAEASIKLTVEEFILLTMIRAKTDQILQNIAIATGKNKSVVMRMIDSLEKKGLVKRTVNPEDRRENLLSTTDMGEQVVAEYHKIEKKLSYELLKGIPDEKVEVFFEVVEEISRRTNRSLTAIKANYPESKAHINRYISNSVIPKFKSSTLPGPQKRQGIPCFNLRHERQRKR